MDGMSERIMHAAVIAANGFLVFMGKCHANCFHQAAHINIKMSNKADHQGFVTNNGTFVNRKEAAKIAFLAGQIEEPEEILFSEMLWSKRDNGKFKYDYVKGYYK